MGETNSSLVYYEEESFPLNLVQGQKVAIAPYHRPLEHSFTQDLPFDIGGLLAAT